MTAIALSPLALIVKLSWRLRRVSQVECSLDKLSFSISFHWSKANLGHAQAQPNMSYYDLGLVNKTKQKTNDHALTPANQQKRKLSVNLIDVNMSTLLRGTVRSTDLDSIKTNYLSSTLCTWQSITN